MTCNDAEPLLAARADGALEPARLGALEDHLADCPDCRDRLAEQIALHVLLASSVALPAPGDFLARMRARIDEDAPAGWFGLADFRVWTLRLVPVAALIALLAILWPQTTAAPVLRAPAALETANPASAPGQRFSPASAADWDRDVSANALLEAALQPSREARVR